MTDIKFSKVLLAKILKHMKDNNTDLAEILAKQAVNDPKIALEIFKVLDRFDRSEQDEILDGQSIEDALVLTIDQANEMQEFDPSNLKEEDEASDES